MGVKDYDLSDDNPGQAALADGVASGKQLQREFHDQWRPKQPSGRVKVVTKVKKMNQLEDNLATMGWSLTKEEMERLDAVSDLPAPYPYEMINRMNKGRRRVCLKLMLQLL